MSLCSVGRSVGAVLAATLRQVAQDKNKLIEEFKQFRAHLESYEPILRQLDDKYQAALRHKMLINLRKERIQNSKQAKPGPAGTQSQEEKKSSGRRIGSGGAHKSVAKAAVGEDFTSSMGMTAERSESLKTISTLELSCSIRAHQMAISCIHLHPRKRILASASDDCTWRLWALPSQGEKVSPSSHFHFILFYSNGLKEYGKNVDFGLHYGETASGQ